LHTVAPPTGQVEARRYEERAQHDASRPCDPRWMGTAHRDAPRRRSGLQRWLNPYALPRKRRRGGTFVPPRRVVAACER